MFKAQYLLAGDVVFGPWVERRGDEIIVTAEMLDHHTSTRMAVNLYTKNKEELGNGDVLPLNILFTVDGRDQRKWSGLKELVRIQVTCQDVANGYVFGRVLDPVWFDAVSAAE